MDHMTRRGFLRGTAGGAAAALLLGRGQAAAQGTTSRTRLILLGTGGGPRILAPGRAKPANLPA